MGRWVQSLEIFNLHISKPGGQCNVDITRDVDLLEVGMIFDQRQLGTKGPRVGHNVLDGL